MSAYTRRDLRVECKRPYAREMRRFVCAFRLRTYGVRSVNPALQCQHLHLIIRDAAIGIHIISIIL